MALKQAFSTTDGVTDLLYVATHLDLCCAPIPGQFSPDISSLIAPLSPGTLDSNFGASSGYEFSDYFMRYYDQTTNTWTDGVANVVPADVRADVYEVYVAILIYQEALRQYNYLVGIQKDVQWRKTMAQALIEACAD